MSEKYLKKLVGKTDIEDALKRLDKLTNEEDRMVTAQVLGTTHDVGKKVAGVDDRVARIDDRIASIDDRVAGVDDRVVCVDERVTVVDDRVVSVDQCVKAIDDKVAVVIEGAQPSLYRQQGNIFSSDVPAAQREKRQG